MGRFTTMQQNFIDEYILSLDQTESARRANFAHPTVAASKLMKNKRISAEINRRLDQIDEKMDVDLEEIIQGLRKIAFAPQTVHVNNSDRLRALELLGKYKRAWTDKSEHTIRTETIPCSAEESREILLDQLRLLDELEAAGTGLPVLPDGIEKEPRLLSPGPIFTDTGR